MSRADIAGYLGRTIEFLSRASSHLREHGYMNAPNPRPIHPRDLPALYGPGRVDVLLTQRLPRSLCPPAPIDFA